MAGSWINALGGNWFNGYLWTGTDLKTLDINITAAINGDGGGNWTPASAISVQSAFPGAVGMMALGPWTMSSGAQALPTTGLFYTYGDSDYHQLVNGHSGSSRTLRTPCLDVRSPTYWYTQTTYIGVCPVGFVGQRSTVLLRLHNGGTLTQAVLTFRVGQTHTGVPAILPQLRLVRLDDNMSLTPLNSSTGGSYVNGWLSPSTPASGTAWYNSGNTQTLTYACDSGTVIDTSRFSYFAEIIDESGANSLCGTGGGNNVYIELALTFTTIADTRPQL